MKILDGAEAFSFSGGENVCLLIHGLTGTPSEMRFLGERLHEAGYSVNAPLLPGHGTIIEDLNQKTWHDWLGAASTELISLKQNYRRVYVAGISMGGLLTLSLLAMFGDKIQSGAVLSTPMRFKGWKAKYLLPVVARSPLPHLIKNVPKSTPDVKDTKEDTHVCYEKDSIPAACSILELIRLVRKRSFLSKIERPLIILQSRFDPVVPLNSAHHIYKKISSQDKDMVILEESYHTITVDKEKVMVADKIIEFFGKH
ncbi:MAG: alpha/beta fold hydrolase [Deltaproteobacteria bacterium]|nr:alpha/beta fold hydrolase [Deltaproteobacteria bacterium]